MLQHFALQYNNRIQYNKIKSKKCPALQSLYSQLRERGVKRMSLKFCLKCSQTF